MDADSTADSTADSVAIGDTDSHILAIAVPVTVYDTCVAEGIYELYGELV